MPKMPLTTKVCLFFLWVTTSTCFTSGINYSCCGQSPPAALSAANRSWPETNKETNLMTRNRKFSSTTFLLVAIGFLSVLSQAQLPAKQLSRLGRRTEARTTPFAPLAAKAQAAGRQSGLNFTFGTIDFPRSPDSTAQGL